MITVAVMPIRVPVVKDNQIFEYSDTLSLPVDATQAHLEPGDVVVINKTNGIAGVLRSRFARRLLSLRRPLVRS